MIFTTSIFIILLCCLIYEVTIGFIHKKKQKKNKALFYQANIMGAILSSLVISILIWVSEYTYLDIGLSRPEIATNSLGYWISTICLTLGFSYFVLMVGLIFVYKFIPPLRNVIIKYQLKLPKHKDTPYNNESRYERNLWICSTLCVNVGKELLYKGVLLAFILIIAPQFIWTAIFICSILFALTKAHMGLGAVIGNSVSGVISCVIAVSMNSVLTLMFFHFILVYFGKLNIEYVEKFKEVNVIENA